MGQKSLAIKRALSLARLAATASGESAVEPGHLCLGLLRDAHDPAGTQMSSRARWEAQRQGLPTSGPHVVGQIVELHGLSLEQLTDAIAGAVLR
jgi:hypothetical protein